MSDASPVELVKSSELFAGAPYVLGYREQLVETETIAALADPPPGNE
jgi:hypothetical protein